MLISIVTASFNSRGTIRDTIESVLGQRHKDVEHIIVDGGSVDGTVGIAGEYQHSGLRIISEPDQGIFDAMNKGISLSSGDVIGTLNSDDFYADDSVLSRVADVFKDPGIDMCYGDLAYVSSADSSKLIRVWKSSPYYQGAFPNGWVPPHPTFFARKSVYERFGLFDISFPLAADFDLMLRFFYRHKLKSLYIPEILVKMRMGGASNKNLRNIIQQNKEIFLSGKKNGIHFGVKFFTFKLYDRFLQYCRAGLSSN